MEMLPTHVLSLHCTIAPVLTLLLAHSPLLVSDKVSAGFRGVFFGFVLVLFFWFSGFGFFGGFF